MLFSAVIIHSFSHLVI